MESGVYDKVLAGSEKPKKKGGKKGLKAMIAAARYDGPDELPNRITDMVSLEQQIRRFLADIGGPNSMSLPPAAKETRRKIHELADAFNLKSQSKGKGKEREEAAGGVLTFFGGYSIVAQPRISAMARLDKVVAKMEEIGFR